MKCAMCGAVIEGQPHYIRRYASVVCSQACAAAPLSPAERLNDLRAVADTLRDLLALYAASPGADPHFFTKGTYAVNRLQGLIDNERDRSPE